MKLRILIALVLSLAAVVLIRAKSDTGNGMIVHEWGTFLAMNGSDGVSLDGMYHEEHALPSFVHARSRDQLRRPTSLLKGETPVIYFYTPQPARVTVHVGFPAGIWTQWYPQAAMVGPGLVQAGSPPQLRNGRIQWDVDVVPPDSRHGVVPAPAADALWNYARDVDAAYVSPADSADPLNRNPAREWERFLFYRGLGEAPLPIQLKSDGGLITAVTNEAQGLRHLFIVRIEHGRGTYAYVPALAAGASTTESMPSMEGALPIDQFAGRIADDVARRLVASGLYEKEARAMVNTWRSSYFKTDGVRVLFVLPQTWTERFIPMRITPAPAQLVRVMVGRVELLDRDRERRAEDAIRNLSSADGRMRERAFETLRAEGRYVEPTVRRAMRTSDDEQVRTLAARLLLTDFVTDLRTALTSAATGEPVRADPLFVRAQLASLLREIGLASEARQEGEAVLSQIAKLGRTAPSMSNHESREWFRALARASEGAGRDGDALRWYGDFVRFGSQSNRCNGCHTTEGPKTMAFFRDWWAGKKLGEYAVKTGEAATLIAAHEATLATDPHSTAAQLSLAYLYEAVGQASRAQEMWKQVGR